MSIPSPASIVIPVYNEESGLAFTLESLRQIGLLNECEIVVVDDGSTDSTAEIAERFGGVRVVRHRVNKGYGAALKTGIRAARAPKVVVLDGDGQHPAGSVRELIRMLDEYVLVIGERDKESFQHRSRVAGKALIRLLAEYLFEQRIPDYNSGFRGFRRQAILRVLHLMPNGFSFSTTSTLAFLKLGHDVGVIPITVSPRQGRRSSVKFARDGAKAVLLVCRIVMLFNPLKIFVPCAGLMTALGLVWAAIGIYFFERVPNTSVALFTLGFLLFFVGLLADQISVLNLKDIAASTEDHLEDYSEHLD